MAAAALLAAARDATPEQRAFYLAQYNAIWTFCWRHFVDHEHGSWFRLIGPDLEKLEVRKCPPGKVDYHCTGMCYDSERALRRLGFA